MAKKNRSPRLELTSLMDVMFLVLVFFIFCIFDMSVHHGVKVDLPNANGVDERGERIVITIRSDDTLQLNGLAVSESEVVERVKAMTKTGLGWPVLISGDQSAHLGLGIRLLSSLKAAGVEKVSFQVRK